MPNLKVPGHLHNIWSRNIFPFSMENCVGYFPLWQEDVQGTTLLSYDQYHHTGAVTGATWGSQGRTFVAASSQWINCGSNSVLDLHGAMTIIVWVKFTSVTGGQNIIFGDASAGGSPLLYNMVLNQFPAAEGGNSGRLAFEYAKAVGTYVTYSTALSINTIYCAMGVRHADNTIDLYIGTASSPLALDNAGAVGTTGAVNSATLTIMTLGRPGNFDGQYLGGTIGEAILFNTDISLAYGENIRLVTKGRYV